MKQLLRDLKIAGDVSFQTEIFHAPFGVHSYLRPIPGYKFHSTGDLHYDRLDLHDWDYVMKRPQDFEQIMKEYPQITAVYLPKFLRLIKEQSLVITLRLKRWFN